ncbi:MAG: dienelactone hydrolase family protein [Cyanobacteria bacterium J06598_3]
MGPRQGFVSRTIEQLRQGISRLRRTVATVTALRVRWISLFAVALSLALLFQACGGTGSSTASYDGTGEKAAETSTPSDATAAQTEGASSDGSSNINTLAQEHSGDKPTPPPIAMAEPSVPVTGQSVTYATVEGQPVTGYLAQPEGTAEDAALPAIMTIHEWWGLNENIEAMTRRLAGEGYTVLAVDLYGNEIATTPDAARDLMRSVMDTPGPAQDNINQAAQFLTNSYGAPTIGSIGWCFGGNWSLRTGLLLERLDAMAIYYGQLILAPEVLDGLDMPIIGFFGEDDSSIPVADVTNFESMLNDLGKTADINLYPGVGHAFANPSGQNYNAAAAEDAWDKTVAFFAAHLQGA